MSCYAPYGMGPARDRATSVWSGGADPRPTLFWVSRPAASCDGGSLRNRPAALPGAAIVVTVGVGCLGFTFREGDGDGRAPTPLVWAALVEIRFPLMVGGAGSCGSDIGVTAGAIVSVQSGRVERMTNSYD